VAEPFHFEQSLAFSPENAAEILRAIPTLPGVFALHGPRVEGQVQAQPYLTRAADLRRRITRILAPAEPSADGRPAQSKRLNLRERVARIEYTITGSEFESTLALYHAASSIFGLDEARRRLKLRTPFFLRFTAENAYPRAYSTNRLSKRALNNFYGPFPSRAAADRYCDAVLDLFKLRRCYEDLAPYPEHPGCVYQEMKKCLAPCNQACTPEGAAAYSAEAEAVKRFFDTRGESMIIALGLEREEASAAMEFEKAAALHAQWHKVKAAQALADELVQPIPRLRAIIVQKAAAPLQNAVILSAAKDPCISSDAPQPYANKTGEPGAPRLASETWVDATTSSGDTEPAASVFLLHAGCITGPTRLSTLGVRAVKEQTSVGSSLFAQPLMLQAIPLEEPTSNAVILSEAPERAEGESNGAESKDPDEANSGMIAPALSTTEPISLTPTLNPEARAAALIESLQAQASAPTDLATLSDHLSLLRRWYYRPEKQRAGEVFFPRAEGSFPREDRTWPIRRILRGAARMALGEPKPMAETHRELVQRNPDDEAQKPTRTKVLHAGRPDVERTVPVLGPDQAPDKRPAFKTRRKSQPTEPR
jgi:excinuclease ABC subunit C